MTERKYRIAWNEARTIGVIVKDDRDSDCEFAQLAYELRKGALNTLGVVSYEFVDAWGDMTADDNCTIEDITLSESPDRT
ncbi:hypothetical protein [Rhizobium leguminosarum]|uniref:hypothetical protein n=1 Tax=Rhizobium leguminosarum TaxID=384 RepID=UPI001441DC3A|nr:hypothetical protein [Rhizobium leguminosarum]MBY5863235.1 hypothetical protein [Rhizobium leguminosarum]NKM04115.1 hypothetical protein [Rhizobium leguminosarum bv. viciae]